VKVSSRVEPSSPALVWANWYKFLQGESIRYEHVASTCYLWAINGHGLIHSSKQTFRISPGFVLRLPWMHDIHYEADNDFPFHLGTLHLIPNYSISQPVEARVSYLKDDPLFHSPSRYSDLNLQTPELASLAEPYARDIVGIGTYAISKFSSNDGSDFLYRSLGKMIQNDGLRWSRETKIAKSYPRELVNIMQHVQANLNLPLGIEELANSVEWSLSTTNRVFRKYLGMTLSTWIRQEKMREAEKLLRESSLRINEVARNVGYQDPLYFSHTFKKYYGISPREFIQKSMRP
jgi:AraC-like DNA-binding protein